MNSQIGQDKWVYDTLNGKTGGYFVELGACDGIYYSNTLFFEKVLGWSGICIEPNDYYYDKLLKNRNCFKSNKLIYSESGKIVDFAICDATSGILNENTGIFTNSNLKIKKITSVLGDLLDEFKAPSIIDYLSLDVEGQEYEILKTFPFNRYKFRCLTVEHNEPHSGSENRMLIRQILLENGYTFVKGNDDILNWGHGPIDDFYVYENLI